MKQLIELIDDVAQQFNVTVEKNGVTLYVTQKLSETFDPQYKYHIKYLGTTYTITVEYMYTVVGSDLPTELIETIIEKLS